jgi:HD-GYP domain-containing protein (c-di-GMP phosphodiesterase class II)
MSYIPIRLGTLRPWQPVNFDIFIKISDRHIHYIKKSDPFDGDRITSLKTKGVKNLFIPADSETDYLTYVDVGLTQLKDTKIALADRADIARDSVATSAENASKNIPNETGCRQTEDQIQKILDFLMSENGAMKQILSTSGVAADVFHHTTHVVTLSLSLAGKLGVVDSKTLMNLGMAALLHDIGKEALDLDPSIPRENLTPEQLKIYQKHPEAALMKTQDKPYINAQILELILNHEEIGEGNGFPKKKRLKTLSISQQILNLCNEYDRVCTVNKVPPLEAIKQFYLDKLGLFELSHLTKLQELIKT